MYTQLLSIARESEIRQTNAHVTDEKRTKIRRKSACPLAQCGNPLCFARGVLLFTHQFDYERLVEQLEFRLLDYSTVNGTLNRKRQAMNCGVSTLFTHTHTLSLSLSLLLNQYSSLLLTKSL